MKTLFGAHYRLIVGAMTVFIVAFTIDVSYQVMARYVSFVPRYLWTEEVARFCFTWALFLGAAAAVHDHAHFTIDVLPSSMNRDLYRTIYILGLLLVGAVSVFLAIAGMRLTVDGVSQISTTSGISKAWVYAAIPVSGVSMTIFVIERLMNARREADQARDHAEGHVTGAE